MALKPHTRPHGEGYERMILERREVINMAKAKMVSVSINLVHAARQLKESKQWTQLPLDLRKRIEEGLKGNGN